MKGVDVVLFRYGDNSPPSHASGFVRYATVEHNWRGAESCVRTRASQTLVLNVARDDERGWAPVRRVVVAPVVSDSGLSPPWMVVEQARIAGRQLPRMDGLPPPSGASEATRRRYARPGAEVLFRELVVVPIAEVPLRIAK